MFVTPAIVAAAERELGAPRTHALACEILPQELANIRSSQRDGRAHDVTTVLYDGRDVLAIAKAAYPPGVYRIPGGALKLGESMAGGAVREAKEETGLSFTPRCYLLRVEVSFTCHAERLAWTTHVVAGPVARHLPAPEDLEEIAEARWVSWQELTGPIATSMLASGRPLLGYRVALHALVYETMSQRGLLPDAPPGRAPEAADGPTRPPG